MAFPPEALLMGLWALSRRRSGQTSTSTPSTRSPAPQQLSAGERDAHNRAAAAAQSEQRASQAAGDGPELQACRALRAYILAGGTSRAQVRDLQRRMGMAAEYLTGYVGYHTRDRAAGFDVEIPPGDQIPAPIRARTQTRPA